MGTCRPDSWIHGSLFFYFYFSMCFFFFHVTLTRKVLTLQTFTFCHPRLDTSTPTCGATCFGAICSVLDKVSSDSFVFLQSLSCLEAALSVLGLGKSELASLTRRFACLNSSLMIFGCIWAESFVSAPGGVISEVPLLLHNFA